MTPASLAAGRAPAAAAGAQPAGDRPLERAYAAWRPVLLPALTRDPIWIAPGFDAGLGPDFLSHARTTIAGAATRTLLAVGPEIDAPVTEVRRLHDQLFARLLEELEADGPVILIYLQMNGDRAQPLCFASGPRGISGELAGTDTDALGGNTALDPSGLLRWCIARGRSWLGEEPAPELSDFADRRFPAATVDYLELRSGDGMNVLVAGATAVTTATAIIWILSRRMRAERMRAERMRAAGENPAGGASSRRAGVPAGLRAALPGLLLPRLPAGRSETGTGVDSTESVGAGEGSTGAGSAGEDSSDAAAAHTLDAAEALQAITDAQQTIRRRVLAAAGLSEDELRTMSEHAGTGQDAVRPSGQQTRLLQRRTPVHDEVLDAVLSSAAITDLAALQVLDRLAAVNRRRMTGETLAEPAVCFFNPLHGQTTGTAQYRSRSGALTVPACIGCEQSIDRGQPPEVLRCRPAGRRGRLRPYYRFDDGYARTGFGAFAPLISDIPEVPAAGPVTGASGPVRTPVTSASGAARTPATDASGPVRRGERRSRLLTSAAMILAAGVLGAGLGAVGSALVVEHAVPAFDTNAGAYRQDYPDERLAAIAAALTDADVYVAPSVAGVYSSADTAAWQQAVQRADVPLRVVAVGTSSNDESGGSAELIAGRLAARTGPGAVLVLDSHGSGHLGLNGYALTDGGTFYGGSIVGGTSVAASPGERSRAAVSALLDTAIHAEADAAPKTAIAPDETDRPGHLSADISTAAALRGAGIGFLASLTAVGLGALGVRAMTTGLRMAREDTGPRNREDEP